MFYRNLRFNPVPLLSNALPALDGNHLILPATAGIFVGFTIQLGEQC